MPAPANWYPEANTTNLRWWDGAQWTEHRVPNPGMQSAGAASQTYAPPTIPAAADAESTAMSAPGRASSQMWAAAAQSKPIAKMWKKQLRAHAIALEYHNKELKALVDKHGLRSFADIDSYRAEVQVEIDTVRSAAELEVTTAEAKLADIQLTIASRAVELAQVQDALIDVNAVAELQSVGLFDFEHPAQSSAELATALESVRYEIKNRIRFKTAVHTTTEFTFNNSQAQGRKFVNDMSKVLLRAYNAEAENAVKATRAGNLAVAQKRLSTAADQIARSGAMIDLRIEPGYHELRLREIALANDHLRVIAREKELERDRRAELREQAKAEAELRKAKETLEKEKSHYLATLAALVSNGDVEGAERMRAKIEDVEKALIDVDYRAANIRAGYVYVISNIGAFGERMVKIGMTRRLEPMDRVNELGDASVPFRFDVHALFFADDAVGIETMLHQTFAAERVNKVNLRREFFYTTPDVVLSALKSHSIEVVEFSVASAAEEFRASILPSPETD